MRRFLSWVACSALMMQTSTILAQYYGPITPNYGLPAKRVATVDLPPLSETMVVGSGLKEEELVIPQQGNVDLGAPQPAVPSYRYAPIATSPDAYAGYECSDCASASCRGECQHKLGSLIGKQHQSCQGGNWFGGLYYMRLWRNDDTFGQPLAFDSGNPTTTVLATGFAHMKNDHALGFRLGKMCSACSAVEFVYWQTLADDMTAIAEAPVVGAPVSSFIDFGSLTYDNLGGGGAVPVNDFFTDAQYISITRTYDYRNFELNFLKLPFVYGANPCAKARVALLAGVRYFHAAESLVFFADDFNNRVGDDPANELKVHNELNNYLVGFQLGGLFDWQFARCVSGQISSKAGIFNNHMNHVQSVTGGAGGAMIGAGPFAGQPFGLETKKDDAAFLAELDAGLAYCLSGNCRLTGGYKILAISGYATATHQLPRSYDNLAAAGLIHNEDSLIVHGAYMGAEFCW